MNSWSGKFISFNKTAQGEAKNGGLWNFLGRYSQSTWTCGRLNYLGKMVIEMLTARNKNAFKGTENDAQESL